MESREWREASRRTALRCPRRSNLSPSFIWHHLRIKLNLINICSQFSAFFVHLKWNIRFTPGCFEERIISLPNHGRHLTKVERSHPLRQLSYRKRTISPPVAGFTPNSNQQHLHTTPHAPRHSIVFILHASYRARRVRISVPTCFPEHHFSPTWVVPRHALVGRICKTLAQKPRTPIIN